MGAEHIIKVFLLCSVVIALAGNSQTEQIAVELEAGIRVRDGDGRVIDPEKQAVVAAMPFRISLALWKFEDFDRVLIRVLKVKGLDPTGIFVPIGQALWSRGGMFNLVLPKDLIRAIHVAYDDGDMLEPKIVASGIDRNRTSTRREKLDKFDRFIAKLHPNHPHACTKHPEEMFDVVASQLRVRYLHECEDVRIEVQRSVHITHRDEDSADTANLYSGRRGALGRCPGE